MNEPKLTNSKTEDPLLAEIDELMDGVTEEPIKEENPSSDEKAAAPDKENEEEPIKEEKVDESEKEEEKKESNEEPDDDVDEEESDDEVLAQLNALAKENRALRTGTFDREEVTKPAVKEEETSTKKEPASAQPVVDPPKGKLLFDNQEQYEKALGSYEDFNKVLLQNQSAVFEMVAQKLIPVVGKMIADYIRNDKTVEKFYSEQNDLTPVKDLVELEADKIRAKEPNLDTVAVLKKAGENARKIVGGYLKRSGKASAKSAKPRLITPNGRASRPQKTVGPDPNSQEALMSDLL